MGASNLARGYSALVNCLIHCLYPHPIEVLHAMGPGRGYFAEGGVFNVSYPPIVDSGIIDAARERQPDISKTLALITDIGNDIMYNVPAAKIIAGLHSIIQELDAMGTEVFVNPIPMVLERDVSERQYRILRRIFFPRSPVTHSGAADAVSKINIFLKEAAGGRIHLLPSAKEYCGVDKIHYSMFHSHKAWSEVVYAMCRVLPMAQTAKISRLSVWTALFANMGRLAFCDMVPIREKIPGTF
jgi:hypothetical protein